MPTGWEKPLLLWALKLPGLPLKGRHYSWDIDFIICRRSPDYYFPGCGVLLQRAMKMKIGALDVRNQCSGL